MAEQNSQDPSMEDILSSIRRILSEDEEAAGEDVSADPEGDAIDFEVQEEIVEEPVYEEVYEETNLDNFEQSFPDEPEEVLELTDNMAYQPETFKDDEAIISQPVASATACSLAELAKAVSKDRNVSLGGQGLTLEEIVRQMLKPFLKEWLDANLPYVVERLVKKEIERVVDKAKW